MERREGRKEGRRGKGQMMGPDQVLAKYYLLTVCYFDIVSI